MAPHKDRRVCLFNNLLSLKVAQSSGSDMFGGENVLEVTSFTGGSYMGDGRQSIFAPLRLYMCTVADRQLSLGVQSRAPHH